MPHSAVDLAIFTHQSTVSDKQLMPSVTLLCFSSESVLRWDHLEQGPLPTGHCCLRLNRKSGYSLEAQVTRLLASGPDPLTATTGDFL